MRIFRNKEKKVNILKIDEEIKTLEDVTKMKLNPKHNFVDFKTNCKDNKITFVFQSKINHKYFK